eukprot:scaffold41040_cov60-Phaeocystis_antarctica.AAC.2
MVWAKQTLYAETEPTDGLVGLADDCLALVATRSQVSLPLAACCKRLRPLMLPKLTAMRTSAMLRLSMLGHY